MKKLLIIALLVACSQTKNIHTPHMDLAFDKEGHRGCRGLMPENTWPAMEKALQLGVTTLEMDAVFTRDKVAILSHEPWFGHEIATRPDGKWVEAKDERSYNIYAMTYEEVMTFDVGLRPHPRFRDQKKMKVVKPRLADIIDSVKSYVHGHHLSFPYLNIETKSTPAGDGIFHPAPEEFVDRLMEVIKEKGVERYTIIQSFDFRTLQYLHRNYPGIMTSMLIEDFDKRSLEQQLADLGFVPTIYSPAWELINRGLLQECHHRGMKVVPWTVNDKAKILQLRDLGVDGIISDFPNLFEGL